MGEKLPTLYLVMDEHGRLETIHKTIESARAAINACAINGYRAGMYIRTAEDCSNIHPNAWLVGKQVA